LQILGCELHKSAFGGRVHPDLLAVIEGRGRERLGIGGRKGGRKGVGRDGKGGDANGEEG